MIELSVHHKTIHQKHREPAKKEPVQTRKNSAPTIIDVMTGTGTETTTSGTEMEITGRTGNSSDQSRIVTIPAERKLCEMAKYHPGKHTGKKGGMNDSPRPVMQPDPAPTHTGRGGDQSQG